MGTANIASQLLAANLELRASTEIVLVKLTENVSVPGTLTSVEGEHHEKAVELLKAAKDSVKLVVRYTPKVLEEMEARFEKLRTARRRQQQQQQRQQQTQQNHMA
ncbi:hypothetical protein GH733_006084 [Mirounga leonina]|nr:hypothetical protein GH733_006084 [Mirounga leonina]